jgi:hypothetical protein
MHLYKTIKVNVQNFKEKIIFPNLTFNGLCITVLHVLGIPASIPLRLVNMLKYLNCSSCLTLNDMNGISLSLKRKELKYCSIIC